MVKVLVYNIEGQQIGEIEFNDLIFNVLINIYVLY